MKAMVSATFQQKDSASQSQIIISENTAYTGHDSELIIEYFKNMIFEIYRLELAFPRATFLPLDTVAKLRTTWLLEF